MSQYKFDDLCDVKSAINSLYIQQQVDNKLDDYSRYNIDENKWKNHFKDFDPEALVDNLKQLQKSLENIQEMDDGLALSHYHKGVLVPVEYDALFVIFSSTSESFRRNHYRQLLDHLFRCLTDKYPVDKVLFENRIKLILPIVKCDVLDHPGTGKQEILDNLEMFLRYPRINQEDIYETVAKKLGSNEFNLMSYHLTPIAIKNGHLGDYYVITIDVVVAKQPISLNFFAKFITARTEKLKKLVESGPSKKEEFFYIRYLSLLRQHGLEKLQDFAARCYFSRQNDLLVLDNLTNMGFEGYPPHTGLQVDVITTGLRRLAAFHASSMILEDIFTKENGTTTTLKQIYGEYLEEVMFTGCAEGLTKVVIELGLESILHALEKFPELYGEFTLEQLREKLKLGSNMSFQKVKESKIYTNVICHGDMHVSNILVKTTDGKCDDVKLVDFQILRYCPLTQDVVFFIVQNTNKTTRDQYFSTFLDQYYTELTQNLKDYGLDPEELIPKQNFLESVNYMKSQAVFQALCYSPILLLGPETRKQIVFQDRNKTQYYLYQNRRALVDLAIEDDVYKTRLKGLIEDFIELCNQGEF